MAIARAAWSGGRAARRCRRCPCGSGCPALDPGRSRRTGCPAAAVEGDSKGQREDQRPGSRSEMTCVDAGLAARRGPAGPAAAGERQEVMTASSGSRSRSRITPGTEPDQDDDRTPCSKRTARSSARDPSGLAAEIPAQPHSAAESVDAPSMTFTSNDGQSQPRTERGGRTKSAIVDLVHVEAVEEHARAAGAGRRRGGCPGASVWRMYSHQARTMPASEPSPARTMQDERDHAAVASGALREDRLEEAVQRAALGGTPTTSPRSAVRIARMISGTVMIGGLSWMCVHLGVSPRSRRRTSGR